MPDAWVMACGKPVEESELPTVAQELLRAAKGINVWMLYGEMGAGKTTLVRDIVKASGASANVSSPTFSIVNEYGKNPKVYHFDLYRLKNETEALDLGFEEYVYSDHLCLIEWPEKVKSLWPEVYFEIKIEFHSSLKRTIYFRRHE